VFRGHNKTDEDHDALLMIASMKSRQIGAAVEPPVSCLPIE
jgi:hypothetical protein